MKTSDDCLFCKIAGGVIATDKVYDDGRLFVIEDLHPAAPNHLLIIPHEHIDTIADLDDGHVDMVGGVYKLAASIARDQGFAEAGYRLVSNCNKDGGQSVYHIHFHLLSGRQMGWPPG